MEITNIAENKQNVAFKIKTTAPKLFVVSPTQGVITYGMLASIRVQVLGKENQNKEI